MFSPPRREKARDDSHLPKGDCRYILLHPELNGLRCACVCFSLNHAIPGSTCDCGHNACYHTREQESSTERQEMEALRERLSQLEERLGEQESHVGQAELVERLGRLEESTEKNKADNDTEMKSMYRGIGGLWHHVGQLQKKTTAHDDNIEGLTDDVQRMRNRLIEVDDASMGLEVRVESLERASSPTGIRCRRRKASTPPSLPDDSSDDPMKSEQSLSRSPSRIILFEEPSHVKDFRARVSSVGSGSQSWTVHVSLLPTPAQPFPFEKDTAAYKRCLSRGLHRVVAIPDSNSSAFISAVSNAFSEILQGRPWDPLVARICDAKNLRGLPMLRQLDAGLVGSDYNEKFLQENCAVTDDSGKILDLYVAMSNDTISWAELKKASQYISGLEAAWNFDHYLDGPSMESDHDGRDPGSARPAAGDILPTWSPTSARSKRKESELSRAGSFGSSTESDNSRAKLRRTRPYTGNIVEVVERRAEAV
ncbi:hypothetical protein B0O99DRAFT_499814 [Bisporella sp. PMI_857]|nr:hypothetical protein B0O99DRAFT_499814 [Bisporella sp. PMI_857]